MTTERPRILLLVDRRNWAFDFSARSIALRLEDRFDFSIRYVREEPDLSREHFDLLYVFFWGEDWYRRFRIPAHKIIKEVASYRWRYEPAYGRLTRERFRERYLDDCSVVVTASRALTELLSPIREDVFHCPKGVEPEVFCSTPAPTGPLKIGWAGNPKDECKGLYDILIPACGDRYQLIASSGRLSRCEVAQLYGRVDVLAVTSYAEGQPLPLIEGSSCGCFPVSTRVGIAPEIIENGFNGLLVERSVAAFDNAFQWCGARLQWLRSGRAENAANALALRSWDIWAERYAEIFEFALAKSRGRATSMPRTVLSSCDRATVELYDPGKRKVASLDYWRQSDRRGRLTGWVRSKSARLSKRRRFW